MNTKMSMMYNGMFSEINPKDLPMEMECEIFLDLGENSNKNLIQKYTTVGQNILPALNEQGQGMAIKQEAGAVLATKLIEAMGLDASDFLEDYTTDEFKQKAEQAVQQQTQENQKRKQIEDRKMMADAALAEANVAFTGAQTKNTSDDNAKQLAVSIDKHFQEWADLQIKAVKEGAELPPRPDYTQILMMANQLLQMSGGNQNAGKPTPDQAGPGGGVMGS